MDPEGGGIVEKEVRRPFPTYFARHYYGDVVRSLFLAAGVILILGAAFGEGPLTPLWTTLTALALALFAGITNPRRRSIAIVDLLIAIGGLLIFAYSALALYQGGADTISIFERSVLALLFFFALYYSARALRGSVSG